MSRGIPLPVIHSPTLAHTLNKVRPRLENYKQELDNLTSDIREVENYIRAAGIAQSFYFTATYWSQNPEENIGQIPKLKGAYWDSLSWDKHDDSKTFRVIHTLWCEDDFCNENDVVFSKPLLESSVNTRKRVFPYLNKFIEELSSAIAVKDSFITSRNNLIKDELPF